MSVDWSTKPWWLRPLIAMIIGVSAGLSITLLLSLFSDTVEFYGFVALIAIAALFCVWQLLTMSRQSHRYQREMKERLAKLDALIAERDK